MIQVVNNNIKCTDPNGKTYYTHRNWLEKFLSILEAEWKTAKITTRMGTVVGENKVMEFVDFKKYPIGYFDNLIKFLEEGDTAVIKGWQFKIEQFTKPVRS